MLPKDYDYSDDPIAKSLKERMEAGGLDSHVIAKKHGKAESNSTPTEGSKAPKISDGLEKEIKKDKNVANASKKAEAANKIKKLSSICMTDEEPAEKSLGEKVKAGVMALFGSHEAKPMHKSA